MIFSLQLLSEMEADLICFADAIIDWKIYKICRTVFLFIMQVYYFRILHIAKTLYKYKKCEQLCILLVIPIENCCDVSNFLHFD
jgi:hypothetical protein